VKQQFLVEIETGPVGCGNAMVYALPKKPITWDELRSHDADNLGFIEVELGPQLVGYEALGAGILDAARSAQRGLPYWNEESIPAFLRGDPPPSAGVK
jgi:hypothetical protein